MKSFKKMLKNIFFLSGLVILLISLSNCQDLFTTNFFSFLQTDPADMSRDELIQYGWDVIAIGDEEKMAAAYNAAENMLADNPDDGELSYLAANLAIELSGLADFLINPPQDDVNEYKSGLDADYIMEAGDYFQTADINDIELNAVDSIYCGIGLLLYTAGGDFDIMEAIDIDSPGPGETEGASYIDAGTDVLGSDFRDLIILVFFTVV